MTRVLFLDTAFSEKQTADWTVGVTIDVDGMERMYLRSVFRERHDATADQNQPDKVTRLDVALAEHIIAVRPHLVGIEEAAFKKKAIADMIRRIQRLLRGRITVSIKAIPIDGDKVTRSRIVDGRLQAGDLYAERSAVWWTKYAAELAAFPMRKEDDQVDATSGAVTMAVEHVALLEQSKGLAEMIRTGQRITYSDGVTPARDEPAEWMRNLR
jgi:predicted phage terminase large subunit-like protein